MTVLYFFRFFIFIFLFLLSFFFIFYFFFSLFFSLFLLLSIGTMDIIDAFDFNTSSQSPPRPPAGSSQQTDALKKNIHQQQNFTLPPRLSGTYMLAAYQGKEQTLDPSLEKQFDTLIQAFPAPPQPSALPPAGNNRSRTSSIASQGEGRESLSESSPGGNSWSFSRFFSKN